MEWWHIAPLIYLVPAVIFLISENRRPQSTIAWTFAFVAFPILGLVAYVMFGRREKNMVIKRHRVRRALPRELESVLADHEEEHRRQVASLARSPTRRDQIAQLVHSNAQASVTGGNRVRILQDAAQTYPAIRQAIRDARRSVHLQFYSWASDAIGDEFGTLLAQKVREGVTVRLLYDPVGSIKMLRPSYVRAMHDAGIDMRPVSKLWKIQTLSYRNHRKLIVVDGRVSLAGGLNIGHEHIDPGPGFAWWRDTFLRVDGPAARAIQSVFAVDWQNATGEDLMTQEHFPASMNGSGDAPGDRVECDIDRADVPMQICPSGPESRWHEIQQFYFAAITTARERTWLTSPYFILDDAISEALRTAAMRGVDVRVMISARGPEQRIPYWAAHTYAAEVARAGVRVFLYSGAYLHAKTVIVDEAFCAVGSANWDIRSFAINFELMQILYDADLTRYMGGRFEEDMAHCEPFDLQGYRSRSRFVRFRDSICRLASPIL